MIRMALKVEREQDALTTLALYVNGAKVSGQCGITLRTAEVVDFVLKTNPDGIEVDSEMVSAHLIERLRSFKNCRIV